MKVQPKEYEVVVGEFFKAAYHLGRTPRGDRWTYRKLAEASGVSKSRIGDLVSGKAKRVNLSTANSLADALGRSPEELFLLKVSHCSDTKIQLAA